MVVKLLPRINWSLFLVTACLSIGIGGMIGLSSSVQFAMIVAVFPIILIVLIALLIWFEQTVLVVLFLLPVIPTGLGIELSSNLPLITWQRLLLAGVWFVLLLRSKDQRCFLVSRNYDKQILFALGLIVLSSLVSSLFAVSIFQSLSNVLASAFDDIGLVFLLLVIGRNRRDFAGRILRALFLSIVVSSFLGFLDYALGFNLLALSPGASNLTFTRLGLRRAQGLLPNPMALSFVTAIGSILGIALFGDSASRNKPLVAFGLLSILVGLMIAFTRTGWLAFLVGFSVWLVLARRDLGRKLFVLFFISASIGGLILASGLADSIITMLLGGLNLVEQNEVATLSSRIQWLIVFWNFVKGDFLRQVLGFGPGSATTLWEVMQTIDMRSAITSSLLIVLLETGILGLFSLLILLLTMGKLSWSLHFTEKVNAFYLSGVVVVLASALTTPIFVWAQTDYVFWIICSCILISNQKTRNTEYVESV